MQVTNKTSQRIILFTLIALIVPMIAFPHQFGTELSRGSLISALYELAFYAVVIAIIKRRGGLIQLVQSAGICLIYRLAMGALFGILIAAMYAMDITISVTLGVASYLPGIFFQAVMAPIVLWPIISQFYREFDKSAEDEGDSKPAPRQNTTRDTGMTSIAVSKDRGFVSKPTSPQPVSGNVASRPAPGRQKETPAPKISAETGGFDRAVLYLGEHGSVQLAAVMDQEGLLMSSYRRGDFEPEDWSPLARVLFEVNSSVVSKCLLREPEKVDMAIDDKRLTIVRCGPFDLMVVAETQTDDVLSIRINQAVDIVRRYTEERYGELLKPSAENTHVRSTK